MARSGALFCSADACGSYGRAALARDAPGLYDLDSPSPVTNRLPAVLFFTKSSSTRALRPFFSRNRSPTGMSGSFVIAWDVSDGVHFSGVTRTPLTHARA